MQKMITSVIQENSIFLEEGNVLLIQEFGKKYGNYYAILSAIASGKTTASEISESVGNASVGGSKGKDVDQNEIDIVAISAESPIVFIAEVKRQRKNFKPELFQQKVEVIRTKLFFKYEIETACLTMEDM